jgi:hypothetical protein
MIGLLALICAALFVGAAVFITVAEQPARLVLDDRAMLLQWQRSYNSAAPMQAGLAMVSALLGFIAAWQMQDWRWAIGAIAILANWPYTLLVIKPTNDRLHGIPAEQSGAEARRTVVAWGSLHAGRSGLGIVAVLFYVWALLR